MKFHRSQFGGQNFPKATARDLVGIVRATKAGPEDFKSAEELRREDAESSPSPPDNTAARKFSENEPAERDGRGERERERESEAERERKPNAKRETERERETECERETERERGETATAPPEPNAKGETERERGDGDGAAGTECERETDRERGRRPRRRRTRRGSRRTWRFCGANSRRCVRCSARGYLGVGLREDKGAPHSEHVPPGDRVTVAKDFFATKDETTACCRGSP